MNKDVKREIFSLLEDLPPESLPVVEQFVRFLHEQARQGKSVGEMHAPYLYPTVPLPVASLDSLIGIMPPVGGDALEDSEALYDQA